MAGRDTGAEEKKQVKDNGMLQATKKVLHYFS